MEKNQIDVEYHISQYPAIISQLHSEIENLKKAASVFNLSQDGRLILTKIKNLEQKMKSKELEKLEICSRLQWNSWSLEYFSLSVSDSENLNEQNVTLRHNQSELQVAIDRYKTLIKTYLHKAENTLLSTSYEYLEKEQRLEEFMVQFEIRDRQYHFLQLQSERLVKIISGMVKSKSQEEILQAWDKDDSTKAIFYDTCTDESEFEDKSLSEVGDDEIENIPFTPKRNNKESNDSMSTVQKYKRDLEFLGDKTPILQTRNRMNLNPTNSPVIQKLKKRRESMIPTMTGRRESIVDHKPRISPRRSRRLSKLPLMNHRPISKC